MGEILWSRMATKGEFLLFEGLNNVVLGANLRDILELNGDK